MIRRSQIYNWELSGSWSDAFIWGYRGLILCNKITPLVLGLFHQASSLAANWPPWPHNKQPKIYIAHVVMSQYVSPKSAKVFGLFKEH